MDEDFKEYRNNELGSVEPYGITREAYQLRVVGGANTQTAWLSVDEAELTAIHRILIGDGVALALDILKANGYAVKAYGAEDVHKVLDAYMHDNTSGVIDTQTYRDEITKHVMEGDDWTGVLDTDDTFYYIWSLIEGTHHDHPEWFPEVKADPLAEMETPELVEGYIQLRVKVNRLSHDEMESIVKFGAELQKRGIIE